MPVEWHTVGAQDPSSLLALGTGGRAARKEQPSAPRAPSSVSLVFEKGEHR